MFIMDISVLQQMTGDAMSADVHLFDSKRATQWRGGVGGSRLPGFQQFIAPDPPAGTTISYRLANAVDDDDVELVIRDAAGEVVRTLEAGGSAGMHVIRWNLQRDRRDGNQGRGGRFRGAPQVPAGTYTAVLSIGGQEYTTPVVVRSDPRYE